MSDVCCLMSDVISVEFLCDVAVTLHSCVFQMHEKAQETEECEEVFLAAAKKFRHSKKVRIILAK